MKKIAVLGLGAMGSRIAINLINAGYDVTVWNRSLESTEAFEAKGVTVATTPKAAVEDAEVVMSLLTDDEASRQVLFDPESGAALGLSQKDIIEDHSQPHAEQTVTIVIESSTLTVDWTQELGKKIERCGAKFLDAPVVGSRPQAEAGQLIYLVGGEAEALAQVHNMLAVVSSVIHHVGTIGQGMAMKLAVNTLFGVQVAVLAEVLGFLSKLGISNSNAMDCLGDLPVTSLAAQSAGNLMMLQKHSPMFPIELVEKDFRYVLQSAQTVNSDFFTARAALRIFQEAMMQGYNKDNITGIAQLF